MVRLGGETEISLVTYLSSVCRATLLLLSELTYLIFSSIKPILADSNKSYCSSEKLGLSYPLEELEVFCMTLI